MSQERDPRVVDNVDRIVQGMNSNEPDASFGDPQVFRYVAPVLGIPFVMVHTRDFAWKATMEMSTALQDLFMGQTYFYTKGIPQRSGNLYIMEILEDQHWENDPDVDHKLRSFIQDRISRLRKQ